MEKKDFIKAKRIELSNFILRSQFEFQRTPSIDEIEDWLGGLYDEAQTAIEAEWKFKGWDETKTIELKSCPFCGGEPELQHIGNLHTKSRKIKIKCKKCRCQRTDAAIYHDFNWLEDVAAKEWNRRK